MGSNEMKRYIFVGCAQGRFDAKDQNGVPMKKECYNVYLISPVSDYKSEDYDALGFKAEKFSCRGPEVWANLIVGEEVNVYFGEKKDVALMTSTGRTVVLVAEQSL